MDDLLKEFLTETAESLAVIDVELVKFEREPDNKQILQNIFRLVHTIKGTSGFLGLRRLESIAHAGENVLGKFRDGDLPVTPAAVTLILGCLDALRAILGALEDSGAEPEGDDGALIHRLDAAAEGGDAAGAPAAPGGTAPAVNEFGAPVAADLLAEVVAAEALGVRAASDESIMAEMKAERTEEAGLATPTPEPVPSPAAAASDRAAPAHIQAPAGAKPVAVPAGAQAEDRASRESQVAASSIRVHVDVLENLMTLVSELVLTRNQLLQMVRGHDDTRFKVPMQRLSHITSDLQEGVMKTRMQPIGNAWAKLPRIVRDLAVESGKKIELLMLGAETELDRQVLDLIKDPLTHMVRNSADHGIERPAERLAAGKPEAGTVRLNAFHEGGHIIIQISDDGRGLDMDRIRAKVLANGLATEAELAAMSEQQLQQFIFKPGFSTAEKVTNVSGRGVGMDVVRTNIDRIGGTIEMASTAGKGSTFTIKIPLTLAIVSGLIVECGGERFAVPQISVLELVRTSARSGNVIESINGAPVLRLRDRLLPLVALRDLLRLDGKKEATGRERFIVVTQVGTYTFGIVVDRVFDTEEIVVKPVAPILRHVPFYSGNTILGDGSVIMILDPNGIAAAAGQTALAGEEAEPQRPAASVGGERTPLLVFRAGGPELKAVPLALVARLEELEAASIEASHGRRVVQYRGSLMPLIPFDPAHEWRPTGRQPTLVFAEKERCMGLVVDEIVDIVEEQLKIELKADRPGIVGAAVVGGKTTDVIDAGHFLTQAYPDWFGSRDAAAAAGDGMRRLLLVDDSAFFRNLLAPVLAGARWQVTAVASADEALRMRDSGATFDAIVSDIEMPGMDGFQLAREIRKDSRWRSVPLVALSSRATERDFSRGRDVGFDDYVAKFDVESLVGTLAETVATAIRKAA
jgi:two-component system chemotaxis sensor kinase CheA